MGDNMIQILACNNNLGNCCTNHSIGSLVSIVSNIIGLIQVIVPIILLIMVSINLTQLVINPDDKKKIKGIKNKFIAAIFVFAVPVIINAFINMVNTDINVVACIKESKNIKVNSNVSYSTNQKDKKNPILSNSNDYENGEERKTKSNNSTTSSNTVTSGEPMSAGEAVIGDSGVKVRKNIYHKKASITRKLNGQEVVDYAKTWVGKLHYSHGTTAELRPGGPCDCSQFIYRVLKHFDAVESEAPSIYCSMWSSGNVKGTILYSDLSKLVPGDIVADYWSDYSQHVEIYAGGNNTVGCDGGHGVGIGHRANKYKTFIHLTAYD